MKKEITQPKMRTAVIKKNKSYKFGKALAKGEKVFIKEEFVGKGRYVFTAYRTKDGVLGFGVTRSEFEYTDKETFVVLVTRTSYSSKNIEVQATDREEAKRLAMDDAGSMEFSEHDADYSADAIFTKNEHENLFK